MIDTDALKNRILNLAIEGKLSEQLESDGNAESIAIEIDKQHKERAEQGKEKYTKIRILDNKMVPFDIPKTWRWFYISDMSIFQEGPGILAKDFRMEGVPLIRIAGMNSDVLSLEGCNYLDPQMVENKWKHFKLDIGDIVISTSASLDRICEVTDETAGAIPYTGQIRFKMLGNIEKEYFKLFIKSPFYMRQINAQKQGGFISHYGPTHLKKMIIPVPPIDEQKRIVERVNAVLELVEIIDLNQKKYSLDLEVLKSKIIDAGIQGKHTEQLPEDGTADELLKQIAEEKKLLIKEKKIKATKALPEITEDEIPFKIPDNWKWVHLEDTGVLQTGATPPKTDPEYFGNDIPFLSPGEIKDNTIVSYDKQGLSKLGIEKARVVDENSVLQVCIGGSIGKAAINDRKVTFNQQINSLTPILCEAKYLFYCMISSQFIGKIQMASAGAATPIINKSKWGELIIPLPPVNEQIRIVERIETILNTINN